MNLICQDCKDGLHEHCPGGTWCECQHRVKTPDVPRLPGR